MSESCSDPGYPAGSAGFYNLDVWWCSSGCSVWFLWLLFSGLTTFRSLDHQEMVATNQVEVVVKDLVVVMDVERFDDDGSASMAITRIIKNVYGVVHQVVRFGFFGFYFPICKSKPNSIYKN